MNPTLVRVHSHQVTVEGDNYLLPQQTVRFLLKALAGLRQVMPANSTGAAVSAGAKATRTAAAAAAAAAGAGLPPALAYLGVYVAGEAPQHCRATSQAEMGQPSVLQEAYDHRARRLILELEDQLKSLEANGMSSHQGKRDSNRGYLGG